jgi:sulfatase maturation enzyme AslB (radical SAM superfamily)
MATIEAKGERLKVVRDSLKRDLLSQRNYLDYLLVKTLGLSPESMNRFLYYLRVSKIATGLRGYFWKVNPRILEIDITYHCNLGCFHCNRSCGHAPSDEEMSIEQIERFINESVQQNRKWKYIKLSGGEPTLHNHIFEIIQLLLSYKERFSPETTIAINTNYFGKKVKEVLSKIPASVEIIKSEKDSKIQTHFIPFNIAPLDSPLSRHLDFATGCCVISFCGSGLTKWGYYPCAVGGAIDRIFGFNMGKKKLPSIDDKDWAREQLKVLCRYCGLFLPYLRVRAKDSNKISQSWKEAYDSYKREKPSLSIY